MKRANGTGSITKISGKRRNKFWVRVTAGFDENGNQAFKSLGTFQNRPKAEKVLLNYFDNPKMFDKITLQYIYDKWSATHYSTISNKTKLMYKNSWNYLSVLADEDIKDIKTETLQSILNNNKDKSFSLLKQIKSLAIQLFDYSIKNDFVNKNYANFLVIIGRHKKDKAVFTDDEVKKLWENTEIQYVDTILILLYTGMRIGELLTLKNEHIDINNWTIQHGNKTDAGKNRIIPIPKKIRGFLTEYMLQNNEYTISRNNKKITTDYYRKSIFNPIIKKLKINQDLTPHSTRHYYATLLNSTVSNKTTIKNLLGHTDYSTTANIYTHEDINELIKAVENL